MSSTQKKLIYLDVLHLILLQLEKSFSDMAGGAYIVFVYYGACG